jgi:tRNA threonylcarbamoyladenosine biosynthesis protein TsaE
MDSMQITTNSPEETEGIARKIAQQAKGGEIIELSSDLGGGKTTFTRGLLAGLGSNEAVASPTFTISREYAKGRLHVYHFDFYRLAEPGIVADELAEVVGDPEGIVVVEWAEIIQHVLPDDRLRIEIQATGEASRRLTITYPDVLRYLVEGP